MGFRDASAYVLRDWVEFHQRVGASALLLHDDHSAETSFPVLPSWIKTGFVRMLRLTNFGWRDPEPLGLGMRSSFVGQYDMLNACL